MGLAEMKEGRGMERGEKDFLSPLFLFEWC
jgi:hypothetical protein